MDIFLVPFTHSFGKKKVTLAVGGDVRCYTKSVISNILFLLILPSPPTTSYISATNSD